MRVQYVASACVLVEHNGIRVLCATKAAEAWKEK